MSTADKLSKLLETKEAIKQAIIDKGGTVGDVFADYPTAIQNIQSGSGTFVVPAGVKFAYSTFKEFPENFDWSEIEQVTDASNLFYNCRSLTTVPKLKFNDLRNTSYMFSYTNITDVDVSEWNTSNLKTMNNMFDNSKISTIPPIDFSNASDLSNVFTYCIITEANINTRSATKIDSLFSNCAALQTVSEIDTSNITSNISKYSSPFYYCYALRNFDGFKGLKVNIYLTDCYSLSYESLMNVINKLSDGVSSKTLYLAQDSVNQLSDDDIAIATNKGWTISPAKTINEPVVVTSLSQVPSSTYNITSKTYDFSQFTGKLGSTSNSALPCKTNIHSFEGDISNANVQFAFGGCTNLKYVSLKTNIAGASNHMFYMCKNLLELTGLEGYATVANSMFQGCEKLETIDLSRLDMSQCVSMELMFEGCSNLKTIIMNTELNPNVKTTSIFKNITTEGTFYYNPAYDYSTIIAQLPATWTAVPLTE